MDRLFIDVYLDEDVDVLLADLLRARGFRALTTREAGQLGSSDADQLAYAVAHGLTLVSHNRQHFELLARQYSQGGQRHRGIILANRRPPYELARRLLVILDQVTADEMMDQIRYV